MIPLAAAGLTTLLGTGIKGITALTQKKKANAIDATRPVYQIPKEIFANRDMYQRLANTTRIPGQSIVENNIGANNAGTINAITRAGTGSSDILGALTDVNNNTNRAYNDLALEGAQYQAQNQARLAGANEQLANYRDQAFDYNQNQPYELALMRKRALEGAANGNLEGIVDDITGFGSALAMGAGGSKMKAAWGNSSFPSAAGSGGARVGLRPQQFYKY